MFEVLTSFSGWIYVSIAVAIGAGLPGCSQTKLHCRTLLVIPGLHISLAIYGLMSSGEAGYNAWLAWGGGLMIIAVPRLIYMCAQIERFGVDGNYLIIPGSVGVLLAVAIFLILKTATDYTSLSIPHLEYGLPFKALNCILCGMSAGFFVGQGVALVTLYRLLLRSGKLTSSGTPAKGR
ncbi:MAG: hypothetical protein JKY49_16860 [Cohaesibacteraceae bacterium]|nr:hypothetical protein [Cohaesibacteraceae bacterium]